MSAPSTRIRMYSDDTSPKIVAGRCSFARADHVRARAGCYVINTHTYAHLLFLAFNAFLTLGLFSGLQMPVGGFPLSR